jgi:AhpD family alkylhydroperoxidase
LEIRLLPQTTNSTVKKEGAMVRIQPVNPADLNDEAEILLNAVCERLGRIPNLINTMAISTAVLSGYWSFQNALTGAKLDEKFREQIGLAVAQANNSEYCLSRHVSLAERIGLSASEIAASRRASSEDPKRDVGLKFVREITVLRGQVSDEIMQEVWAAGYSDAEIVEIVATVAFEIFTNYLDHVARTDVDFPHVSTAIE